MTCPNEWCGAKVDRPGQKCGPCTRSEARTARLMERVEKARIRAQNFRETRREEPK